MALESTHRMYTRMRRELLEQPIPHIFWIFQLILHELGFGWKDRKDLTRQIFGIIRRQAKEPTAVKVIWELVKGQAATLEQTLEGRARLFYNHVQEHLMGHEIVDFGCGDGRIGIMVEHDGNNVLLYDVQDYRRNRFKGNFTTNWSDVEKRHFDTALALTVLHHCDTPGTEIRRVKKVARRIIVIESVVSREMSWAEMAFVDWFYNRCFHPGTEIPVPGNYMDVDGWRDLWSQEGLRVVHEEDLGVDLPIVPEMHHLFILERT